VILRHLLAIGLLPATVTGVVPLVIVRATDEAGLGWGGPHGLAAVPVVAGVALLGVGSILVVWTIALFVRIGRGTLAPWDATRHLVVHGPYRHVRNPMISGVLFILLGEAALLGSLPLLAWFAAALTVNAVYIPLVEEPGLDRRFRDEYREYREAVPRWLPRPRPWAGPSDTVSAPGP
jgi:protein-S-isoprenylcysteine O-methyltransferase Ste14